MIWLGRLDSNQGCRYQKPVPYRLATPQNKSRRDSVAVDPAYSLKNFIVQCTEIRFLHFKTKQTLFMWKSHFLLLNS